MDPGVRPARPIAVLERQATRRDPELVPIRHRRMVASPFAFFRGAAAIMAHDLANRPVTGLRAQLCGDAHLVNFGVFDTPERAHVFDINDFDETLPGPWEWDVRRLTASIEVAGRDLGLGRSARRRAVLAAVAGYREQMHIRRDGQPRGPLRAPVGVRRPRTLRLARKQQDLRASTAVS